MTELRTPKQTSTHTVTLTFDVAADSEGSVDDFVQDMAGQIHHHAYYNQAVSLIPATLKAKYTL